MTCDSSLSRDVVSPCDAESFSLLPPPPPSSPEAGAQSDTGTPEPPQAIYAEFDDDFEEEEEEEGEGGEEEELTVPIGRCTAMYNFPGTSRPSFTCLTSAVTTAAS